MLPTQPQEVCMNDDPDDLKDERRGIVRQLLDTLLGRSESNEDETHERIHRIGTINRLLDDDD
jgi:hypothetical protein